MITSWPFREPSVPRDQFVTSREGALGARARRPGAWWPRARRDLKARLLVDNAAPAPTPPRPRRVPLSQKRKELICFTTRSSTGDGPKAGFTLVELLTVLAVIAILVALLVPSMSMVRRQAIETRVRSQLAQYVLAYEAYRAAFGHYPSMGQSGASFSLRGNNAVFVETLSGSRMSGGAPSTSYAQQANPRRLCFHAFAESEWAPPKSAFANEIVDAFGNPNLHVVIDRDLDGVIPPEAFSVLPVERRPGRPLRGGVFFFVSNAENNPDWQWILSWE